MVARRAALLPAGMSRSSAQFQRSDIAGARTCSSPDDTKKHHIPSPKDEIWRLKKIKKDGPYHKRLVEHGISTVEGFLKSLNMDERKLSSILFGKRVANRDWKTIVQHASKCDLGHKHSSHINPGQQIETCL